MAGHNGLNRPFRQCGKRVDPAVDIRSFLPEQGGMDVMKEDIPGRQQLLFRQIDYETVSAPMTTGYSSPCLIRMIFADSFGILSSFSAVRIVAPGNRLLPPV